MQVYGKLAEKLGLSDHLTVLNVMLGKIATNLKVYGACDEVIESTLTLFQVRPRFPFPQIIQGMSQFTVVMFRWCNRAGIASLRTVGRSLRTPVGERGVRSSDG